MKAERIAARKRFAAELARRDAEAGLMPGSGPVGRPAKHGLARRGQLHPLFWTWIAMIRRCEDPNHHGYRHYGARGIRVCARWRDDFAAFAAFMGDRPPGKTLDRSDPNGNYEPGNVRWATPKEQAANRRPRVRR